MVTGSWCTPSLVRIRCFKSGVNARESLIIEQSNVFQGQVQSLAYTSKGCSPIGVHPVPNAYTIPQQTTGDIFNVLLRDVVYALGLEVSQLVYTLLTYKLVQCAECIRNKRKLHAGPVSFQPNCNFNNCSYFPHQMSTDHVLFACRKISRHAFFFLSPLCSSTLDSQGTLDLLVINRVGVAKQGYNGLGSICQSGSVSDLSCLNHLTFDLEIWYGNRPCLRPGQDFRSWSHAVVVAHHCCL